MPGPRILQLNLHRECRYRNRTGYWKTRLESREYDFIRFRNGYGPNVPEMDVEWKGVEKVIRNREPQYAIKLGGILSLKRWRE